MAVIHISEAEAVLSDILVKVKNGEHVHIENGYRTVAVVQPPSYPRVFPKFSEALRLAEEQNPQILLDDQFGNDMEEIIRRYR